MPLVDKILRAEYQRNYWKRNYSNLRQLRVNLKNSKKSFLLNSKSNPCTDCGRIFIIEAMTYDHPPGSKSHSIFRLASHPTASLESMISEISKCDLVCIGCHRLRTESRLPPYVTSCPEHRPTRQFGCKKCTHYNSLATLRTKRLELVRNLKNKPCIDCGLRFHPCQMDFDHIHDKSDNVSNLVGSQASLQRISDEIKKCEVVCCWCHVTRTVKRNHNDLH